ncbi:molybdenum cofactor guanylyltransferase [Nonomuraea rhodomycinica]|uniref:NTP transferase domain-containing protein n=1 Tax=Nonomuraea rhodomycinica TaxID=1712872 RepID=A0A7Y6IRF5_9ACTN|nr:NTP transferase domain-containing protein [Nonomuraea rhodomycinica]NUW41709.1 NTP transferase domain-containing protein [Nonomuraea rhodomycinica]
MDAGYDAVVLAGGEARRLGGADKPGLVVGGRTLLERVAGAVSGAGRVVVVGPARDLPGVVFTQEDPPGGGPVPALRAGLREVTAPRVVLLAADLPFLTPPHISALLAAADAPDAPAPAARRDADPHAAPRALPEGSVAARRVHPAQGSTPTASGDHGAAPERGEGVLGRRAGVVAVDGDGREQWLLGVWDTGALREALGRYGGRSLRGVLAPLVAARVRLPGRAWFDCDTMDDLYQARLGDTTRVPFPTTGGGAPPGP